MPLKSLIQRMLGQNPEMFSKISNPQNAGGDMTKIPVGKTTESNIDFNGMPMPMGKLFNNFFGGEAGAPPTGAKGDYVSKTFKEGFKMKKGGIARGCGKVLEDRRKVTKYY